jgi:ankyrin repeat protein
MYNAAYLYYPENSPFLKHLRAGLDVSTFRFERGRTPLMDAASLNYYDLVIALVNHGVDLDDRDDNGQTALMYGIFNVKIVKILLENGANVRCMNDRGWTALDYAKDSGNENVIRDAMGITDGDTANEDTADIPQEVYTE